MSSFFHEVLPTLYTRGGHLGCISSGGILQDYRATGTAGFSPA